MLADKPLHPSLAAGDIDRARAWYSEKLGLEPEQVGDGGESHYRTGGSRFLLYPSEHAGTNQATAAAWIVDDCEKTVAALKERGVVFEDYDFGELATVDGVLHLPDGSVGAWFKDSEGNILGLFQEA